MHDVSVAAFVPVLQVAIAPVVLLSGTGLLLLSMTNRLARTIDRSRALVREMRAQPAEERGSMEAQLRILAKRASLCRQAIILAALCMLLVGALIIVLFLASLFQGIDAWLIGALFIASMLCLIVSLILFILDVHQSLVALKLEVEAAGVDWR
jgi:hypothetical protein